MKRLLFPIILLALLPAAKASVIAYMASGSDNFGTVDLTTGAYTHIGSMGHLLAGLGVSGSNIYGGVFRGNTLYQVNTGTGALTSVGTTTISYDAFGSTLTGMYAIDTSFNLYSVSTAGATTLIGPTGVSLGSLWGMSDNSATLYLSNGTNLYTVNTASGHATLVGGLTGGKEIGAMLFSGGTLYGGVDSPALTIDTINVGTGAATFLDNLNPTSDGNFWGLAPGPGVVGAVPEPNSSWLLLSGLAVVGWRQIKRIRR